MPKGVYVKSDEHKKKISDSLKKIPSNRLGKTGHKLTAEHRIKIGKSTRRENHWNWKGGECIGNKSQYFDVHYKLWRESVFKRDNHACQNCKVSNVYITAHHIKSWKNYPELRYEIDNGLTLCEDCHSKTDNYKGKVKGSKIL